MRRRNFTGVCKVADGIILGEQIYKKMTAAWLEAAHIVFELDGNREALQEFRYAFGRNPRHIRKAVERFPELWGDDSPDLFQLLASIQLSKIKDDDTAQAIFSDWVGNTDAGLDTLKELIADHTDKRERKKKMLDVSVMCPNCRADVKTVVCV